MIKTQQPRPKPSLGAKGRKPRVFLVDDHPIVRRGLTELLRQEPNLEICGESDDFPSTLAGVARWRPDLVIMDISLKGRDGIELIKSLKATHPKLLILVLSMHDEALYAERALRAGACGYIQKEQANQNLTHALRKVMNGEVYLSASAGTPMLEQYGMGKQAAAGSSLSRLTDREMEVFRLLGQGKQTFEMAQKLGLSVKTIEAHRAHIRQKLALSTGNELIIYAIRWYQSEKGN